MQTKNIPLFFVLLPRRRDLSELITAIKGQI